MKLKNLFYFIINLIFPHNCLFCYKITASQNYTGVCLNCHKKIKWFNINKYPALQKDLKEHNIDDFNAAYIYNNETSQPILNYKFNDQPQLGKTFASLLRNKAQELIKDDEFIIIPVPIHQKRLYNRKYNQASLLAKFLAKNLNIEYSNNALKRIKNTPHQTGQNAAIRKKQLSKAFLADEKVLNGKNILLVDDVFTTGSTIYLCAEELKAKGANKIKVLTIAYTEL